MKRIQASQAAREWARIVRQRDVGDMARGLALACLVGKIDQMEKLANSIRATHGLRCACNLCQQAKDALLVEWKG